MHGAAAQHEHEHGHNRLRHHQGMSMSSKNMQQQTHEHEHHRQEAMVDSKQDFQGVFMCSSFETKRLFFETLDNFFNVSRFRNKTRLVFETRDNFFVFFFRFRQQKTRFLFT